jgi:hypothetical protein
MYWEFNAPNFFKRTTCFVAILFCGCKTRGDLSPLTSDRVHLANLDDGRSHPFPVLWRNQGGVGSIQKKGDHYSVEFTLALIGASTYCNAQAKDYQKEVGKAPKFDSFYRSSNNRVTKTTLRSSYGENSDSKSHLQGLVASIEDAFNTPFMDLRINIVFLSDNDLLPKNENGNGKTEYECDPANYNLRQLRLADLQNNWNGLFDKKKEVHSRAAAYFDENVFAYLKQAQETADIKTKPENWVVVLAPAVPNGTVVTPNLWDIQAQPLLLAHEVGHLLGTITEGYLYKDYPPAGLMSDEVIFDTLAKAKRSDCKVRFLKSDLAEALKSRNFRPAGFLGKPSDLLFKDSYGVTFEDLNAFAKLKSENTTAWLKSHKNGNCIPRDL